MDAMYRVLALILLVFDRSCTVLVEVETVNVAFVVLSQGANVKSVNYGEEFKTGMKLQAKGQVPPVHLVHEEWPTVIGAWTIFPILKKLVSIHKEKRPWIFICEERTRVKLDSMISLLKTHPSDKVYFIGNALHDVEPTIIHHFASSNGPDKFLYPNPSSGFLLSFPLLERIAEKGELRDSKLPEFSIDATYELANFIGGEGTRLLHAPQLCVDDGPGCASYLEYQKIPSCGFPVQNHDIFFAVKTCSQFHETRVRVVKETWGSVATHVTFFSNESDPTVPTFYIGVPNTELGHCAKTFAILENALPLMENNGISWLAVTDDDTLLSVQRLRRFLSCYNSSRNVAVGERYGYRTSSASGYDYLTGGAGMVFSKGLVKLLVESSGCRCPRADSPDDMFIGMCLQSLRVPIAHSPLFHQARPADYPEDMLLHQEPISFHKHWMMDPVRSYNEWLIAETDEDHDEL